MGSGVRAGVYIGEQKQGGRHLKRARWLPPIYVPTIPTLHAPLDADNPWRADYRAPCLRSDRSFLQLSD